MLRPLSLAASTLALTLSLAAPDLALAQGAASGAGTAAPGAPLDTRAASQRRCLEEARGHGFSVLHMSRPSPVMSHRIGEVWGERVRMRVASAGGETTLICTYVIGEMEAYLRRL